MAVEYISFSFVADLVKRIAIAKWLKGLNSLTPAFFSVRYGSLLQILFAYLWVNFKISTEFKICIDILAN